MKKELGTAMLSYHLDGKLSTLSFSPKMQSIAPEDLCKQLTASDYICNPKTEEQITRSAENVLSYYFSQLNEVELADREKYRITSELTVTHRYENGNISVCGVTFYLEEIQQ